MTSWKWWLKLPPFDAWKRGDFVAGQVGGDRLPQRKHRRHRHGLVVWWPGHTLWELPAGRNDAWWGRGRRGPGEIWENVGKIVGKMWGKWWVILWKSRFGAEIPSGKLLHNYGKPQFLMAKSTISTGPFSIANCNKLPEGMWNNWEIWWTDEPKTGEFHQLWCIHQSSGAAKQVWWFRQHEDWWEWTSWAQWDFGSFGPRWIW